MTPAHPHAPVSIALCIPDDADTHILAQLEEHARTLKVVRRCADLVELEAAARAGIAQIGVLSGNDPDCDKPFIQSLHDAGMKVILLQDYTPSGEAIGTQSLMDLKPDLLAPALDPERIAHALLSLARGQSADQHDPGSPAANTVQAHASVQSSPNLDLSHAKSEHPPAGADGASSSADISAQDADRNQSSDEALTDPQVNGQDPHEHNEAAHRNEAEDEHPLTPADSAWLHNAATRQRPGKIIAIWGTSGAPGRTTVAINLAASLHHTNALPRMEVLLIDADTYSPSVAHALGMSTDVSSLSAIARYAARGEVHAEHIDSAQQVSDEGIATLTGLSSPHRWREASPAALTQCLQAAREQNEYVIVDCASGTLDPLDEFGRFNAGRDEATAAVLQAADLVVVVARSDAEGLHRLIFSLEWLRTHITGAQVHIVANMVSEHRAGSRPAQAIAQALAPYLPGEDISLIYEDPLVLKAQLQGRSVISAPHKGSAERDFAELSQRLLRILAHTERPISSDQIPTRPRARHRKIQAPRMLSLAQNLRKRRKAQTRDRS